MCFSKPPTAELPGRPSAKISLAKIPACPPASASLVPKGADKQRGAIYALAPSFKNINTLWAGTDDGLIWQTRDGGKNWNDITPKDLTPWSKVTQLSASHFDEDTAYASVSRFRINDNRPYIYRTHDAGKNWTLITTGLPDFGPVDTVREDPVRKGLLFAGTENSVWISFDDGDHWQSLQLNLPHTSMRDLWIHDNDLIVGTHGRSFWILDDITALREVKNLSTSEAHLFTPAPAVRIQRDTYTDTPLPPDEPFAANPPDGAILDYYLPHASSPVTLEILDARGQLVRKFSSTDKPEVTEEELKKQLIPLYWLRPFQALSADAGMHRWVWDLHYPAPDSTRHEYPISAIPGDTPRLPLGPTAMPGTYTARLTVDGKNYTASFVLKMDPRVKTSTAGLERKFQLETRLASLAEPDVASRATSGIDSRSATKANSASHWIRCAILFKHSKINSWHFSVLPPVSSLRQPTRTLSLRTNSQIAVLYGQIWQVDADPTASQSEAFAAIERDASDVMKRWDAFRTTDLPALNHSLGGANLPEIKIDTDAHKDEGNMDEE